MTFFAELAANLIDNSFDNVGLRDRSPSRPGSDLSATIESGGIGIHLYPTKHRRRDKCGSAGSAWKQGRCGVCYTKTTWVCSECRDRNGIEQFVCHPKGKRLTCFGEHLTTANNY